MADVNRGPEPLIEGILLRFASYIHTAEHTVDPLECGHCQRTAVVVTRHLLDTLDVLAKLARPHSVFELAPSQDVSPFVGSFHEPADLDRGTRVDDAVLERHRTANDTDRVVIDAEHPLGP